MGSAATADREFIMRIAGKRPASALIAASLAGGCLTAGATASASTATASAGTATPCTTKTSSASPLYGVNYDYAGASEFRAANVEPLLRKLDPATLRYPGGTEADYFDWHKGMPTRNQHTYRFTLDKLKTACVATKAMPIFDLNVLTPANRLNTTDQVNMLKAAKAKGLPVKYVEIGNELYGGRGAAAFPSGNKYASTVVAYVKALHRDFPGVRVAADAVFAGSGPRQKNWNSQVLAATTGAGAPDALILHDYPGTIYDPFTQADVAPLFGEAYTEVKHLTSAVASLHGKPVWLTEYNFGGPFAQRKKPNPVRTSYARELYVAEFALMLPRIPHLALADNWSALAGGKFFSAWTNPKSPELTPSGQAVAMIDAASHGATSSAAITIAGAPTLPGGGAAVTGQAFTGPGRATTALLVNLTGSARNVPTGADVPDGARYQQAAGTPTAQQSAASALTAGTVSGKDLKLPAYSITLVNTTTDA
jgi:hypothetical protein